MPGEELPSSFREAREEGRVQELREKERGSKNRTTDTDSFLREDVAPGSVLAAKEVRKPCRLEEISFRVEGLVGRGAKAVLSLERGEDTVAAEKQISEGSTTWNAPKFWNELKKEDFLQITLKTESEDVTPLQKVLTTFIVTHD